jgi:hypothetical protein
LLLLEVWLVLVSMVAVLMKVLLLVPGGLMAQRPAAVVRALL